MLRLEVMKAGGCRGGRQSVINLTCCKALVCHVKEWHVPLGLAQVSYLLPLLRGGVNAGGVVRTACKKTRQPHERTLSIPHTSGGICEQAKLTAELPAGSV